MVNIECQSNSLVLDNHLHLLPKIGSSTNLYHYLIKNKSSPPAVDCDTDRPMGTAMTSSLSSDSAIVIDDTATSDHSDFLNQPNNCRNSWPSSMDTNVSSIISLAKYKRPLPWTNSSSQYIAPNKVLRRAFVFSRRTLSSFEPWPLLVSPRTTSPWYAN